MHIDLQIIAQSDSVKLTVDELYFIYIKIIKSMNYFIFKSILSKKMLKNVRNFNKEHSVIVEKTTRWAFFILYKSFY